MVSIIKVEINWLNRLIDQKILRGQDYRVEARRHKQLLSKLARV